MPRFEISIDDAHTCDLRVASMLERHRLRGMFYVPATSRGRRGINGLTDKEILLLSKKHDIGFHSFSHPEDIKVISDPEELDVQVTRGRKELESLIGRPVTSFCYPRGKHSPRVREAVKKAGYAEARTVNVGATTLKGTDPFQKPTTVHVHPSREEYGNKPWWHYGFERLNMALQNGDEGYFHLWGHGWEIEKFNQWDELDKFLNIIDHL